MNKLLLTTLISSLVLAGCGGSSNKSQDDTPPSPTPTPTPTPTVSPLLGKWNASNACQFDNEGPMYFTENLTISPDTITVERTNYAADDYFCEEAGTEDNKTFKYTTGALVTPTNADGIKMQQIDVTGETKIALYVSPGSKHLIVTDGVEDAEGNISYPTSFRIDDHYTKDGAGFAPSGATVTVLSRRGINLTTGIISQVSDVDYDIATIAWSPSNLGPEDAAFKNGWNTGVFIKPNYMGLVDPEDFNIYIKDMGKIALQEVTAAPTIWPVLDIDHLSPLSQDHAYVVRLLNGQYAKLRVLHQPDVESVEWSILIEYELMN